MNSKLEELGSSSLISYVNQQKILGNHSFQQAFILATFASFRFLSKIYGAITFYLANQELINRYLEKGEEEFEKLRLSLRERNPALYQKLIAAKAQKQGKA
ncbi:MULTISPECIES: hypothetical protein [Chroococcidiopsis]|uniref:hypothetical protein n=1 Tax=Chroococcidiopsis TaxID=54298 RepID=UPI0002D433F1|nr:MULTISPECIES: hypothetical protein [Chroococcidiopsis]PSB49681.1 hypothetical protein C7B80_01225 [Cyanosarcina cf. burmensis CCALA 770]URD53052.1 hypothetical protein M5J74_13865 [Chroococcidiopsis sp. CCNUC1]